MLVIFNGDDARFAAINQGMKNILIMKKLFSGIILRPHRFFPKGSSKKLPKNASKTIIILCDGFPLAKNSNNCVKKQIVREKAKFYCGRESTLVAAVINFPEKIFLINWPRHRNAQQSKKKIFFRKKNLHHPTRAQTGWGRSLGFAEPHQPREKKWKMLIKLKNSSLPPKKKELMEPTKKQFIKRGKINSLLHC